jgi:hypothetical protein
MMITGRQGADSQRSYKTHSRPLRSNKMARSTRAFRQSFNLADHVKVVTAAIDNGLLRICDSGLKRWGSTSHRCPAFASPVRCGFVRSSLPRSSTEG